MPMARALTPYKLRIDAAFALMSSIALKFASIEKSPCSLHHDPARLSDAREKSDKKMLGFPTAAARAPSYDETKFSGNAATRPMFHVCRACFHENEGQPCGCMQERIRH
ncbi:hypothetical protein [Herbaspirillum aquaticum]|uniref:hypothetical protein n=1 Tax=Herbaspirillum aquaticum TaxID=568783 RepID=UPI0024DE7B90|nr:hypothetical protein [Herbaspirillum aquaticum]